MRELEFADQALHPARLLERIEVFPLDVLDQRHGERRRIRNVPHQDRHLASPAIFAARQRRSPAMIS